MVTDYKKQGKANRRKGARFELKVRENLENDGWTVDKWSNGVDLEKEEICSAKRRFNPFTKRIQGIGTGFPDFIAFRKVNSSRNCRYSLILVECKFNGKLSKIEKQKMNFLMEEKFSCWKAYYNDGVKFEKLRPFKFR